MKQGKPLRQDPEKFRAMQDRAREKALAKLREKGAKLAPREAGGGAIVRSGGFTSRAAAGGRMSQSRTPAAGSGKTTKPATRQTSRASGTTGSAEARKPPKHNDGPWRQWCIAARGEQCRSCGDTTNVEMDHVIPKSQDQSARADVENGLPLCGAFSRNTPGGCHPAKTAGTLKFEFEWFDPDQIQYLKDKGWVDWDETGQPFGRGMKHFQPRRPRLGTEKVDTHGKDSD